MQITRKPASDVFSFDRVEVTDARVEEFIQAERVSGKTDGFEFSVAVMSACCVFDDKKQPVEELRKMSHADFLELSRAINGEGPAPATGPAKLPGE